MAHLLDPLFNIDYDLNLPPSTLGMLGLPPNLLSQFGLGGMAQPGVPLTHRGIPGGATAGGARHRPAYHFPLEVREFDEGLLLLGDLPGVDIKDVNIEVSDDNVLRIWGEKPFSKRGRKARFPVAERGYGRFSRSVKLPDDVDVENIMVSLDNGVLEIFIPKLEFEEQLREMESGISRLGARPRRGTRDRSNKKILVLGATGHQGCAITRKLCKEGWTVIGGTRDSSQSECKDLSDNFGVEFVELDFESVNSLENAMRGMYGVFAMTDYWDSRHRGTGRPIGAETEVRHGRNIITAAERAGVRHLIFSSTVGAGSSTGVPHMESKYSIENFLIKQCPVPSEAEQERTRHTAWTILRPSFFMDNFDITPGHGGSLGRAILEKGIIKMPLAPGRPFAMLSLRDYARIVAMVFDQPEEFLYQRFDVASDLLSPEQIVEVFREVRPTLEKAAKMREVNILTPNDLERFSDKKRELGLMYRWFNENGPPPVCLAGIRSLLGGTLSLSEHLVRYGGWGSQLELPEVPPTEIGRGVRLGGKKGKQQRKQQKAREIKVTRPETTVTGEKISQGPSQQRKRSRSASATAEGTSVPIKTFDDARQRLADLSKRLGLQTSERTGPSKGRRRTSSADYEKTGSYAEELKFDEKGKQKISSGKQGAIIGEREEPKYYGQKGLGGKGSSGVRIPVGEHRE